MLTSILIFFFNAPATTEIYTLSLHDALPISGGGPAQGEPVRGEDLEQSARISFDEALRGATRRLHLVRLDRKSTRLNSSHSQISYAVFCLKKKKKKK